MTQPPAPMPRGAPAILLTLWLVMFVSSSQFLLIAPALEAIATGLHVELDLASLLVSGYAAATGIMALFIGPISDKVGRRMVLRAGSALMAVALLLHGFADSFPMLLALRVLAGCASGLLSGASVAYVGDLFPYHVRGRSLGVVMSAFAFGQIIGIPLGTVLAGEYFFQLPFVLFGVLMCGATVLTFVALPHVSGAASGTLTVGSALRSYRELLSRPEIVALNAASITMMLSVSAFIMLQPTWIKAAFHENDRTIAVMFMIGGLANAVAGTLAGWASDLIGRRGLVIGASIGLSVLMLAVPYSPNIYVIGAFFFMTMIAVGMRISPLNALMTALVEGRQRGTLMSLSMATGQIGSALGAALAGPLYKHWGFASNGALAAVFALVTAIIIAAFVPEPVES